MFRVAAYLLGLILIILVAVVVYLGNADLGRFKEQITPFISDSLGRELVIDGALSLRLGRTVRIRAEDISLANAPWADEPLMLELDSLEADVDFRSMIRGPLRVENIELGGMLLRLQQAKDGRRNWSHRDAGGDRDTTDKAATDSLPYISTLVAHQVRILVSSDALTRRTEIAIDEFNIGVRDGKLVSELNADVNDVPFRLQSEIGPADRIAAMTDLMLRLDATLGEITLKSHVDVADLRSLALRSADIELDAPDADYLFDVLNLPTMTSGPTSLRATLVRDSKRPGFSATGRLGEYRVSAEGWLEDVWGDGGYDARIVFSGPDLAVLGQRFALGRLPASPFRVDGRVRSRTAGIEIEDATIAIGEHTVQADGSIVGRPNGGNTVFVSARTRDISGRFSAVTANGLSPLGAEFDFELDGPDAREIARRFEFEGLASAPFALSGRGTYESDRLLLETARVEFDGQRLGVTGSIGLDRKGEDTDLRVTAEELDLSRWVRLDERYFPALEQVAATGRLQLTGEWLQLHDLSLQAAGVSLEGNVAVSLDRGGDTGRFELHVDAPSAREISPALRRFRLADEPLSLSGTGTWQHDGWEIHEAVLRMPGRGGLSGNLAFANGDRPLVVVKLAAERLDLHTDRADPEARAAAPDDDRVIPAREIPLEWLAGFDADFAVDIDSLDSGLTTGALVRMIGELRDGRLAVTELETEGKRGRLQATLSVELEDDAYAVELGVEGQALRVAPPDEPEAALAARPAYDLSASLKAGGRDLRALADTLNGRIRVRAGPGTIPRRQGLLSTPIFKDFLSSTFETINPLVRKRDEMQLDCIVLHLDIDDGTAHGDPFFALQTRDFNLLARGSIDLGDESLNLDIASQPRRGLGISLGDLINPFTRVSGTLASPRIVADPKSAVVETGVGIATGGLWPLAKKLRGRFLGGNPCAKALS